MKLKRNDPVARGRGKYGVILYGRLNALDQATRTEVEAQIAGLLELGILTDGEAEGPDEFFVIMLKDICARPALLAYAGEASKIDREYADDVFELAHRSGKSSPFCKEPD